MLLLAQTVNPETPPKQREVVQEIEAPPKCVLPSVAKAKRSPPRQIKLGKSACGNSLEATAFGKGKKRVIVIGGIHGDESATPIVARALAATLERERVPAGLTVMIVPEANPDGLLSGTRVNGRGVDINRNFPSTTWRSDYEDEQYNPGEAPASEPETRAIIRMLKRYRPRLIITLHAALGCMNWDGPANQTAELMACVNGYPLCPDLGYETPGSLGTYAGIDGKIPIVTVELRDADNTDLVKENLPALIAALDDFASTRAK